jgi:hypothetical protein
LNARKQINISLINEGHLQSWDHWHLRSLAERHCGLELVEWDFDATWLPYLSDIARICLGNKWTILLETGPFLKLFPLFCISVIGLFRVKGQPKRASQTETESKSASPA